MDNKTDVNYEVSKTENTITLDDKEQQLIKQLRIKQDQRNTCIKEIDALLQKYGAKLVVDPQSPFGKPEITVMLV